MLRKKEAHIYTADPVVLRKLSSNSEYQLVKEYVNGGRVIAKDFTFDKKLITLRSKKKTVTLTDEQKAQASERMKVIHKAKK